MLEAGVGDAALVEVDDLQVVAEGILGLDEGSDGAGTSVTDVEVSFK